MASGVYKRTKEIRHKIGLSCKGRIPWNKGLKGVCKPNSGSFKKGEGWVKLNKSRIGQKLSLEHRKKISLAHQGKRHPHSEETKIKLSKFCGKDASGWRGGISRLPYPFDFNEELKELIRKRDYYKCTLCGVPQEECIKKLHVHHIDYDKNNINPNNLITLCRSCHSKTNANRDFWKEKLRRLI